MDYYFLIITILDTFALGILCVFTKYSEVLDKRQRCWFIRAFTLIIFISVLEVITVAVDQKSPALRWVNILANYLGFGLTPAVPIFLASALENNRSARYALGLEGAFLLFLAVTFPAGLVFYVDQSNHYMRGGYFGIYIAAYCCAIVYLLAVTLRLAANHRNKSRYSICFISVFLLASTMIQVCYPGIHVTWMCVSLLSILYYTYCNGIWQQLDQLTGLLNQKSYLNRTAVLSENGMLVVFDVDNFKYINDHYGHGMGDRCLEAVAACIKTAYSGYGSCYRIGGDEFCVLLEEKADAQRCYRRLLKELEKKREALKILPYVSVGSARYSAGDNVRRVKEIADSNMYRFKKNRKGHQGVPPC